MNCMKIKSRNETEQPAFGRHFYGAAVVGERGQIVIPKEARDSFCIKTGDKLVILGRPGKGILLVKSEQLRKFAEQILSKI